MILVNSSAQGSKFEFDHISVNLTELIFVKICWGFSGFTKIARLGKEWRFSASEPGGVWAVGSLLLSTGLNPIHNMKGIAKLPFSPFGTHVSVWPFFGNSEWWRMGRYGDVLTKCQFFDCRCWYPARLALKKRLFCSPDFDKISLAILAQCG